MIGFTQSMDMISILEQVEQNNQELKALASYVRSKKLELKSGNNLPDPQFGAYYLPFGEHSQGDYREYQLTQSFEFPTVYGARNGLIDKQSDQLELDYQIKRQEILSRAKVLVLNHIYLSKRLEIETLRIERAKRVFEQVNELHEKEEVGILELNKAKVAWLQEQSKNKQIESDLKNVLLQLRNLNGGIELELSIFAYESSLELPSKDLIWSAKQLNDATLKELRQQGEIAQQSLKLVKNKSLPNLTAGYNSQGFSGERFSGLYAGLTLPLWSNRNKVKAAQSQLDYQQSFASAKTLEAYSEFEKQYNDYEIMLSKYQEYESTFAGLNSDDLLLQAYRIGELSFLEYYMELQFYHDAHDDMLNIEFQLYLSQNTLLKHQL